MSTVLLTGATGLVGRLCLKLLLADPAFEKIKVITRRPLYEEHPKLSAYITDFEKLETLEADLTADIVICCLGSTLKDAGSREQFMKIDHDYPLQIAQIAHRHGGKHFIVISAIGADKKSLFFYSRVKGLLEADIKSIPYETISIFQPSLIDGERKEVRVMEQLTLGIARPLSGLLPRSLNKYKPIEASEIARAICHVAQASTPGIHYYQKNEISNLSLHYTI